MVIKMYAIFCRETLRQMKFEGKLAAQAGHAYLHAWWNAEDRFGKFKSAAGRTRAENSYLDIM